MRRYCRVGNVEFGFAKPVWKRWRWGKGICALDGCVMWDFGPLFLTLLRGERQK